MEDGAAVATTAEDATPANAPAGDAAAAAAPPCPKQRRRKSKQPRRDFPDPDWTKCTFWLPKKHRHCSMMRKPGSQRCGEHQGGGDAGGDAGGGAGGDAAAATGCAHATPACANCQVEPRVPCPHDPTHTVKASGLQRHLKACHVYQARLRLEAQPFFARHLNSGSAAGGGERGEALRDGDQQRAAKVREAQQAQLQQPERAQVGKGRGPPAKPAPAQRARSGRLDFGRFAAWVGALGAALDAQMPPADDEGRAAGDWAEAGVEEGAEAEELLSERLRSGFGRGSAGSAAAFSEEKHLKQQAAIVALMGRAGLLSAGTDAAFIEFGVGIHSCCWSCC